MSPLSPRPVRPMAAMILAGASFFFAGCVSLDPSGSYHEAMSLVEARSGWRPDWNAPWSGDVRPWDATSPLTVDLAVTIALRNNRGLRARLEDIASAHADLVQSGLLPNPVLSASFGTPFDGSGGPVSISVDLVQQLTDLWLRPARTDAAAAKLREQVLGVSDDALRLVADVRRVHAQLAYGQRRADLIDAQIDLVDRAIETATRRMAAGVGTQLDVNRLRQVLLGLQAERTRERLVQDRRKRGLLERLGLAEAGADWRVAEANEPVEDWPGGVDETRIVELTERQRLDVAAAERVYDARVHDLRAANLGSIPELGAGPLYDRDESDRNLLGPQINLEIPIFDTNKAQAAKAMAALRKAAAEADEARQRAVAQARRAWLEARTNMELVRFYRDRVLVLAGENHALARQSLDAGQIDMTVVLETQRELIQARLQLNRLEAGAAGSMIELEYAVGGSLASLAPPGAPPGAEKGSGVFDPSSIACSRVGPGPRQQTDRPEAGAPCPSDRGLGGPGSGHRHATAPRPPSASRLRGGENKRPGVFSRLFPR